MSLASDNTLGLLAMAGAGALVYWLWRREASSTDDDPQVMPADPGTPAVNVQGPSFVEDNPTDEVVATLLSADIARRPYSVRYQDGATDFYMRFVDDLSSVNELQNTAEVIHWLNNQRKVQVQ